MHSSSSMARRLCSRKFSSIMKNECAPSCASMSRHHGEQLLAGVVEIQVLALAAEERRSGAEVAAHGAAHRGNDGGGGAAAGLRQLHPHGAPAEAGDDRGMADGRAFVFAQKTPHPGDAVAAHDVVGVDHLFDARNGRHVPAHHDGRARRQAPHHPAHLPHLAHVHDDGRDADDVVVVRRQLRLERLARGEIEHRGGRGDVLLDHEDAPRAVEHAQRERALLARHLVVVQLHRIDLPAAERIVLGIRTENGAEQNTGARALSDVETY